jgi:DNA topoisomerase-2
MQTPIVRVFLKSSQLIFYDESAFKKYAEKQNKKLKVKYYKGLGTSNNKEVKETFGKKIIEFIEDKNTGSVMNKCFGNDTGVRKDWLTNYDPTKTGTSVGNDPGTIELGISKYLNTELIKFSLDDCSRSIPNLFDGLKQSQRKILYTCFSRKLNYTGKVLKVAQLSGSVAELTSYHHGEQNLYTTITKMAQVFTGSNNIPLLFRDGQFGSLMSMGKDAASARYIFTKLEMLTRYLYKQEDDVLLKHLEDDGEKIEPECYVPIIPMILINGSSGIGTGWSCNVPCFNPLDIINCIKIWLENDGKDVVDFSDPMFKISIFPELKPWYRGFSGNIEKDDDRKFTSYGIMTEEMGNKKIITQLPIGMSIDKFKEYLEELEDKKSIKKFNNYSKPNKPYFEIFENTGGMEYSLHSLKLETTIRTSNMVLFLTDGKLKKFESIDEIIDQFCQVRYRLYTDRKNYMLNELQNNLKWTSNKRRFLEEVMEDKLILRRREEEDITKEMENKGYDKKIKKQKLEIERINEEMEESEIKEKGYDYLLTLHIRSFTKAMLAKLDKEIAELKIKIKELTLISEKDLWLKDLEEFENVYVKWLKIIEIEEESAKIKKKNNKKK